MAAILLPQALAVAGDYFRRRQFGFVDNRHPRDQYAALTGAGARTRAAEQNAWEALPVFAIAVFVAHLEGADPRLSAFASLLFIISRVLHAAFYVSDFPTLRSTSYLAGLGCCGWLFILAVLA